MVVLLVIVCLYVASFLFGFASMALPPLPDSQRLLQARSCRLPFVVGVEKHRFPVYSDGLTDVLAKTGIFAAVDHLSNVPNAQIVARVEEEISGVAAIPCLTIVTLGIIPTVLTERWGEVFSLRRRDAEPSASLRLNFRYSGPSVLGIVAPIAPLVSSNQAMANPRSTSRYIDALSVAITERAPEIMRLFGR